MRHAVRALVYLGLALAAFLVLRPDALHDQGEAEWEGRVQAILKAHAGYQRQQDSLKTAISERQAFIRQAVIKANNARLSQDSLKVVLVRDTTVQDSLKTALQGWQKAQEEAGSLRLALAAADSVAGLERQRADNAERRVKGLELLLQQRPKACRIPVIGLSCPTLTVGAGAVVNGSGLHTGPGATLGFKIRV